MESVDLGAGAQHYYKAGHANKELGYQDHAPLANVLDKAQFEADKQAVYR